MKKKEMNGLTETIKWKVKFWEALNSSEYMKKQARYSRLMALFLAGAYDKIIED